MKIKIYDVKNKCEINAEIISAEDYNGTLPSLTENWRFNFKKHSKLKNTKTFVLVSSESKEIIEGCLIFEIKDKVEPYMAYIEIAPHNRGENKKFEKVGGCLIAFASRLSFLHGQNDYKGWLTFDVLEENKDDEIKLMALYSKKYNAMRLGETTIMIISPENGEKLIEFYLK